MKIKLNLKLLNKLTAILVVGCFFVSSVCRDAIAVAATPTMNAQEYKQIFTDFMLPYSYGKISGSHFAGTDRVVINIQDLHCHPQVQKSISNIIEMFDNKYGVSNVYLEGAYGNVSAKPFLKNLINPTQRNEILDKLLQSGRLTGAEYYSAISNKTEIIKGLENKGPYLENLKRFGSLLEAQDQIAVMLKGIEESTKKVKEQYYTRRQYKIEKLSKDYLEGKIKAEKYYRLLAKHTEKLGIDLTKYENTFLYMQLLALQSDLNYKAITTQLQTLVLLLKENLPPNAYQILLDNTKNFEETDKLYAYIIKLSKSFGLDLAINFKELDKYFSFIELSQRINPLELLKEEENLTREINTRFSDTVAQREVVFLTNFEKYLKDYLSTKITSDDYEYYKENIETYKKLWNKYVDNKVLSLLEPYMQETDKFYKINTDRNNYFTENIFDGIETNKIEDIKEEPNEVSKIIENMDKVKRVDIIITGGFHSQTVSEILKQHGISYIVITPNVQDGVKEAEKTYYQIAKQQKEINFQTLAARIVFDLFGDENLSQIARIKVLKDYNLSKQEVKDIIGTNVENRLLEDIFSLTDEEFIKKYNPQYDNNLQHVFGNTSAVIGLINVAEQLESDDISPTNFRKLTKIVAKEYGISNEKELEQISQKAIKIIENGENSSILDAFTNIFKSGNQDVVLTILEVYNNYNPKTVDYFLDDKENKFEYDKEKGLYKFENDKKIYLKDYKIVDEVPMESSKESKKLEQQEISTERKFYKEMEEKIENFDFSLNRPNRNIVEENIKNLNVIIDEILISELLNDEERISLTKKLEDKVVDLIYPKDNKKEGLNILRKSTKNALIPGNVITTSMFVKDILESKLSDGAKIKIIEGVEVSDIEDNRTKDKVLEIKEKIEVGNLTSFENEINSLESVEDGEKLKTEIENSSLNSKDKERLKIEINEKISNTDTYFENQVMNYFESKIDKLNKEKDLSELLGDIEENQYLVDAQKNSLKKKIVEKNIDNLEIKNVIIQEVDLDNIENNNELSVDDKKNINRIIEQIKSLTDKSESDKLLEKLESKINANIYVNENNLLNPGGGLFSSFNFPITATVSLISPFIKKLGINDKTLSIYEIFVAPAWEEPLFGGLVSFGIMSFIALSPFGWITGFIAFNLFVTTRLLFALLHYWYTDSGEKKETKKKNLKVRLIETFFTSIPYAIVLFGGMPMAAPLITGLAGSFPLLPLVVGVLGTLPPLAVATIGAIGIHIIFNFLAQKFGFSSLSLMGENQISDKEAILNEIEDEERLKNLLKERDILAGEASSDDTKEKVIELILEILKKHQYMIYEKGGIIYQFSEKDIPFMIDIGYEIGSVYRFSNTDDFFNDDNKEKLIKDMCEKNKYETINFVMQQINNKQEHNYAEMTDIYIKFYPESKEFEEIIKIMLEENKYSISTITRVVDNLKKFDKKKKKLLFESENERIKNFIDIFSGIGYTVTFETLCDMDLRTFKQFMNLTYLIGNWSEEEKTQIVSKIEDKNVFEILINLGNISDSLLEAFVNYSDIQKLLKTILLSEFKDKYGQKHVGLDYSSIYSDDNFFALRLFSNKYFNNKFEEDFKEKKEGIFKGSKMPFEDDVEGISLKVVEEIKYNCNRINEIMKIINIESARDTMTISSIEAWHLANEKKDLEDEINNLEKELAVLYYLFTGERNNDIKQIIDYFLKEETLSPFKSFKISIDKLEDEEKNILRDSGLLVKRDFKSIMKYKRAGGFWLFLHELNENNELRKILGINEYINFDILIKGDSTLNDLIDIYFDFVLNFGEYDRENKQIRLNSSARMFGFGHNEYWMDRPRIPFVITQILADLVGVNNDNIKLYRLGDSIEGVEGVKDRETLIKNLSDNVRNALYKSGKNNNAPLYFVFAGHGAETFLECADGQFIKYDEIVDMFRDDEGNIKEDLSNVLFDDSSCNSNAFIRKNLSAAFRKAGVKQLPTFVSEAGYRTETKYGYIIPDTYINGKKVVSSNFHLGLFNYIQYRILTEGPLYPNLTTRQLFEKLFPEGITIKDLLMAELFVSKANSSLFTSNENNLEAYNKIIDVLKNSNSNVFVTKNITKKQINDISSFFGNFINKLKVAESYNVEQWTVMLSILNSVKKYFENKGWNDEEGIKNLIYRTISFLDKTAPVWEELVFRAIPMTMSPGIFIVSQIMFILLHFKELNTKEKLTITVLTMGLSSIYVGMSICFPGTLPLAYAIAMIIHAINNKYGPVKLSIFDKVKNMFKGNNKLQEILDSLDENFEGKNFFINFIDFAELENKDEINKLVDILNNINTRTPYMTIRCINLIVNTIQNIDNEMYDLISKKDFRTEYYNSKLYREIIDMLKNIDTDIDYKVFHKKITEKVINVLKNDEVSNVKELNESVKEKICDNFSDFLFTEDEISLLKNLLRQNNDSIEQILDSFAGIKQFDDDVLSRQIWFREKSFIPNFKTFLSNEKNIDNFSSFINKLENKLNTKDNYSAADRNAIRTDLLMFLFRDKEIFDYFINNKENQDILLSNLSVVNIESDKEYNGAIDFYRLPTDVGINLLMGYIKPVNLKEWYIQSPVNTNQISKMETTINPIFKCGDERIFWGENKEVAKQRNCNDADETKSLFNAFCNSGVDVSKNSSVDKIFKEKTGFSIDEIKNGITKDIMFRRNEKDLKKEQIKYSSEDIMAMYSDDIVYAIATIMKQKDEKENNIRNTNFSKLTKGINYSFKCPLFDGPCFVPYSEILNTGYIIGDCTGSLASGKNNVYFRNNRIFLKSFNTIIYYKNGKLIQKYMIHYDDNNMHIMSVEEHQDFRDNKNNQEDSEIDFKEQFFFESLDFMHNIAGEKSIYIETLNSNTGWLMETIGQITTKDKSESINLLTQGGLDYLLKLNVNFEDIDAKINEIKEKSKKIKAYRLLTGAGVYGNLVTVMYEIQDFIRDIDEYKYKNDENKGILYRQMQMKIQKEKNSITDDDFARKIKIEQKENDLTKNMNNVLKLESILNNENIEMKNNKIKITGNTDVFDNFINNFSEIVRYVPTYKLSDNEKGDQGFVLPIGNNRNIEVELVKNGNVNLVNKKRYTKIEDESKVNRNIPKGYKEDIKNKIKDEINKEKVKQIKYNFKNENIYEDNKDKYEIEVIGIKEDGNLEVTFEIYREKEKIGVCTCEINITDDLKVYIKEDIENDSIETKLITDNEMEIFMDKIRSYNLDDRVKNKIKEENISEVVIPFTPEKINESRLVESKTVNAKFNQQGTAISQNTYETTKEESNLTTQTVNLLRKSLNPVGTLANISVEFLGSEVIKADKLFLYSHDISEAELKKAENDGCTSIKYRIVNEAETSRGVSNIKIKQEEGKADIRVKYDGKNNEVIIYSKDGIRNLSNKEIQVLVKQAFREGRRIKVFSKVGTLTFATGREKNSNDIMNTMNVETIDSSVTAPTENVYKFASDEKFMPTTISGKVKETGLSTFEISKEHYDEYGSKEQDCKFIVRETNTNNIEQTFDNIGDNQSGVSFDFSETNIVNQENILNSIKEQKGKSKKAMNLSVYVKFNYEVYETLSGINIFEQYGIIPIVDKNSVSIVKGKKMLDIDEENKIEDIEKLKNQSDIFGFMFDENSVDKLGSVIGGIRTIIEYLTNDKSIYSPQEKFKDGLRKAFRSNKLEKSNGENFNCTINLENIKDLKELLQIDVSPDLSEVKEVAEKEKIIIKDIKEAFDKLNLSKLFKDDNDAKIYIESLIAKDNYIEALGFIRGVVMNTVADKISNELSGKGIEGINIIGNIEDNEIQGILIWTIQELLEGKTIKKLYNQYTTSFEIKTAEEIFESIRLDLSKILAENEYKINLGEERKSTIAKSEELPTLIMSDYGKKGIAEKEFNVSANTIKSMLAAA